jgi:hypothetical protein
MIKSKRMSWAGNVACMGRSTYMILVGSPVGKKLLGRLDIFGRIILKINLREIGWGDKGCIDVGQNRDQWRALVITVMNLRVP